MNKDEIVLEITEEDILTGQRGSPERCPIALAGRRVFNRTVSVANNVKVYTKGWECLWRNTHSYKISEEVKWFMYNFDVGNKVEPISIN